MDKNLADAEVCGCMSLEHGMGKKEKRTDFYIFTPKSPAFLTVRFLQAAGKSKHQTAGISIFNFKGMISDRIRLYAVVFSQENTLKRGWQAISGLSQYEEDLQTGELVT